MWTIVSEIFDPPPFCGPFYSIKGIESNVWTFWKKPSPQPGPHGMCMSPYWYCKVYRNFRQIFCIHEIRMPIQDSLQVNKQTKILLLIHKIFVFRNRNERTPSKENVPTSNHTSRPPVSGIFRFDVNLFLFLKNTFFFKDNHFCLLEQTLNVDISMSTTF